jgi:sugar phosphate isomerase/epimerase
MTNPILLGTILLEPNRWAAGRVPTYRVSEWLDRMREAGFDGLELWENHAAMAPDGEIQALCRSPLPVTVFNSYATMDDAGRERRRRAAALARRLKATGVKFNVGADPGRLEAELANVRSWAAEMPGARLLCECHPGTALEDPETAAQALASCPDIGAIVHAFSVPDLGLWFRHLGARIAHVHVQLTDDAGRRCRLRAQSGFARERLAMVHDLGFAGTFTVEFTEGVGTPPEDQEALFRAAVDDLAFLKEDGR